MNTTTSIFKSEEEKKMELLPIRMAGLVVPTFTLAPEALLMKEKVLAALAKIEAVGSLPSKEIAAEAVVAAKQYLKLMEEGRVGVKKPIDNIAEGIQSLNKAHTDPVKTGVDRVAKLMGYFDNELRKEAEELERKRQEAMRAEVKKLQEAEEAATKAAQAAANAKTTAELLKAQGELAKASAAAEAWRSVIVESAPIVAETTKGVKRYHTTVYEIVDFALATKSHPELFELVPKDQFIKDTIKTVKELKGFKITEQYLTK